MPPFYPSAMSENDNGTTVPVQRTNSNDDDGRPSYASAGEETVCASYLTFPSGHTPEDYLAFNIGAENAPVTLELQRVTTNYAVYDSESGAVSGLYVNLDEFDGEPPEETGFAIAEATEEDFEESGTSADEEVEALFG
jgi:hypothetical protein